MYVPVFGNRKDGSGTTRIKKVTGNRDAFIRELRAVLNLPPPINASQRLDPIRIRVGGTIEVKGNRTRDIKGWLAGLGF
jgi:Mitochondrial large subunit ribosomal protein (Img2)